MGKTAIEGASRLNAFGCDPNDLVIVGYDTKDGPEHPLWDGDRLPLVLESITEEWVANILALGVLEPVLVRKNGARLEIVVGRRRVLGARAANRILGEAGQPLLRVTVMVHRADDKKSFSAIVAENEGRLNDNEIVRAKKARRFLERGYSVQDAAIAMCVPVREVERLLPLLDLADEVQTLIEQRKIGLTVALTLRDLVRDEQVVKAVEYAASGATVEEARQQTQLRKAKKSGNGHAEIKKRPKPGFIKKLAEDDDFRSGLSPDARALLDFINGDETAARRVKGLTSRLASTGTKNLLSASANDGE